MTSLRAGHFAHMRRSARVTTSAHALGSPARGAVAALCAVTEGLVQRRCGETKLSVNRGRAGVEDKPLRRVGRWVRGIQRRPLTNASAGVEAGWRMEPASSVDRRRRTEDGAPYGVWESISVKPTSSVIRRKGRRGRRPLRWVRDSGFSGAVRCSLSHLLRFMPQARLRCCP